MLIGVAYLLISCNYYRKMKRRIYILVRYPVALALIPAFISSLYCPFPIPWVLCHICEVPYCSFKYIRRWLLLSIIISTAIFGRIFCSWICPLGSLQDILGHAIRVKYFWKGFRSKPLLAIRLVLLIISIIVITYLLLSPVLIEPVELLIRSIEFLSDKRIYLLLIILLLSALIFRPWCLVCPLGSLLGVFNRVCLIKFTIDKRACNECHLCTKICKTGLKLRELHSSCDCIKCLDCNISCTSRAFKPTVRYFQSSEE